jgi:hypothetical protein
MGSVLEALRLVHGDNGPIEIRIGSIESRTWRSSLHSTPEGAARAAQWAEEQGTYQVYMTVQAAKDDARATVMDQHEHPVSKRGYALKDSDMESYRWLLIDIDADRPDKDQAATDEELGSALETARAVAAHLHGLGFVDPQILIESGNGYHLYYPMELPATAKSMASETLKKIRATGFPEVDTSVSNPARILRVPGTTNRKGENTTERPHRVCQMLDIGLLELPPSSPGASLSEDFLQGFVKSDEPQAEPSRLRTCSTGSCDLTPFGRGGAYIATRDPAIQGQEGDKHTFATACHLAELGCSESEVLDLMIDWNSICQPRWSRAELADKARRAVKTVGGKRKPKPVYRKAVREAQKDADRDSLMGTMPPRGNREGELPEGGASGESSADGPVPVVRETGGEPDSDDGDDSDDARPVVFCPGGKLRVQKYNLRDALSALRAPLFYYRAGSLVSIEDHEIRLADAESVVTDIVEHVKFRGKRKIDGTWRVVEINPPQALMASLRSRPAHFALGEIRYLTTSPIILPCGRVTMEPGYYPESGVYYTGLVRCEPVPEHPTVEQVREAVVDLWKPFQEFPFVDREADWANLLAMMLVLVARLLFGKTPPWMATANNPGTGKGLAMETAILLATGETTPVTIWDDNEAELRKSITTYLRESRKFILWDNVNHHIDSPAFCALSTATRWRDRLLGGNSSVSLDCHSVLALTANNPSASREVLRRFVYVCLRADSESPEKQNQERSWRVELPGHVHAHQERLIASLLTLWRAWFSAGKPLATDTHVSYEDFSHRIGGVLSVAGVPGFLGNAEKMRSVADPETVAWRRFVACWSTHFGTTPVTSSQLHRLCVYDDPDICHSDRTDRLLPEVLGSGNDRSQSTRLGRALGRMRDRIFGAWRITKLDELHEGRSSQYILSPSPSSMTPDLFTRPERPDVRNSLDEPTDGGVSHFRTSSGRADNVRRTL